MPRVRGRFITAGAVAMAVAAMAAICTLSVAGAAAAATADATAPAAAAAAVAPAAAAAAAVPAAGARVPPRALARELTRAQMLLHRRLMRLPSDSGVQVIRGSHSLVLRVPTRLLFAPDSTVLRRGDASAAAALTAATQLLKRRRRLVAQIDVYTDNIGGASLNRSFSQQRADAVVAALSAAGIRTARLQAHGDGLQGALDGNDTPEGRSENRRLEIVFERAFDAAADTAAARAAPVPPLRPVPATAPAGG
ncbi:MAG: OmpA family protein [Steroidobacteraceae bacterium]